MKNYEKAAEYVKTFEGYAPVAYQCPTGHLTVGYGHNLEDNVIGKTVANMLLKQDLEQAEVALKVAFPWYEKLDEARQFVLLDMAFNMGIKKLCTFRKTLAFIVAGDYKAASEEMLVSRWAKQVKGRAYKLAYIMREGVY